MNISNIFAGITVVLGSVLLLFTLYGVFVCLPVAFYAKAECLRLGYPKAEITIWLERYCVTLDGAVAVKVVPR